MSALNAGLEAARAPWIARLDADDLVHPRRFEWQLDLALRDDLDVVGTGIRCFPVRTVTAGLKRYEAWQNGLLTHGDMARERFVESPLIQPSAMFRRDAVMALGGYRDLGWPEDYDLWLRLFEAGARFGKCSEILTFWRDHPGRLTRTGAQCTPDAVGRCRVAGLLRGPLSAATDIFIAGAGKDAKRLARLLAAAGRPPTAFLDIDPRRLGQRIGSVPVLALEALPHPPRAPQIVLAAVGGAGRRDGMRAHLEAAGMMELRDFYCVA